MPPPNADLQTMWAYLEEGMDHVMTHGDLDKSKHMSLYTAVYNYCETPTGGNPNSSVLLGGRSQCSLSSIHPSLTRRFGRM